MPLLFGAEEAPPAECALFGPQRERILEAGKFGRKPGRFSEMTAQVMGRMRSFVPGGSRTNAQYQLDEMGMIDRNILWDAAGKGRYARANRCAEHFECGRQDAFRRAAEVPAHDR